MKKILAALAASAMVVSMMGVSAMAEGLDGEGDTIEDFYAMEEKEGGYNPFWDMQEEK